MIITDNLGHPLYLNMDTFLEVLKWIGIALAAGFVGYFGRYPAKMLFDKITGVNKTPPEKVSAKDEGERQLELEKSRLKIEKKAASPSWFEETSAAMSGRAGSLQKNSDKNAYIDHLLGYVDNEALKPLKIVVNGGNGCAGPVIDLLEKHLPFTFIKLGHIPDGSFPNGVPNPLLPDRREATAHAVRENGADLGIAWDGDFDRCFFYFSR